MRPLMVRDARGAHMRSPCGRRGWHAEKRARCETRPPLPLEGRPVERVFDRHLQDGAEGADELVVADHRGEVDEALVAQRSADFLDQAVGHVFAVGREARSEEQPSELQSLMRISYAVFCL